MFSSIEEAAARRFVVWTFLLSRWLRLYPVYIVSIALAALSYMVLSKYRLSYPPKPWLADGRFDARNILGHLALIGVFDTTRFKQSNLVNRV